MRRVPIGVPAAAVLLALAAAGCGKSAPDSSGAARTAAASPATRLSATTPAPSGDAGRITWALYREVGTLDPIQAFDYPENTVDTALCDSLLRQQPDGTITPGLAEKAEHPNPTTLLLTLRSGPTFWDGKPVTAADAAFSLRRAADPKAGGFYPQVFARVASIAVTGDRQVTIKLKQPDYWLDGELSGMAGIVVEKAYVEREGKKFGTPAGGTMCSGPFKVKAWKPGSQLAVERNGDYWDSEHRARVAEIDFKGVPDDASLTSGFLTGAIDGSYQPPPTTYEQLKASANLTVTPGPSFATDALVISSLKGALGDVRVRQALSLAVDREAYIAALYHGQARMPRTLANPGTWGYGRSVFEADWNRLADPVRDVAKAKRLVQQAGASGKTIVIGMTSEIAVINSSATALRQAGASIGLKVKLKAVSAQSYINFFTDPKAREGIDAFPTVNYPDYADPAAFYATFALPGGSQNYDGYQDAAVTEALERARGTADPDARAKLVARAGDRLRAQLPWIPMAAPSTLLVTSRKLTGAPSSFVYMGGSWANMLGAT
jgi:peptide/nickel transport system substrate-binding protein